jgi:uncharacterized protein (TIGR00369 family)
MSQSRERPTRNGDIPRGRDLSVPRDAAAARAVVSELLAKQPYAALLGYSLVDAADLAVTLTMPLREAFLQPFVVHGGAVASLADAACTLSVLTRLWPDAWATTVEHSLHFLRPVTASQIVEGAALHVFAHVRRFGNTLSFVEASVTLDGREIAVSQGTQMRQTIPR